MKKKLLLRSLWGIPTGIAIGCVISIATSLIWGGGCYSPCVPGLVSVMGSEIRAVILQTALCGLLGAGFSGSSIIWEIEDWNILKQTGIYFSINSLIMMPVAYFTHWMKHSILGFLQYFGIFVLIFLIVWAVQFLISRHTIAAINTRLQNIRQKGQK